MTLNATYSTTTPAFRLTTTPDVGVALPSTDPSQYGNRPLAAFLQATTHDMRFTTDGTTPTSSHGMVLTAGANPFFYAGPLTEIQFIQAASGSVLNVVYSADNSAKGAQGAQGAQGSTGAQGGTGAQGDAGGELHVDLADIGAVDIGVSGYDLIASPGPGSYLVPTLFEFLGTEAINNLLGAWNSSDPYIALDSDLGYQFTGGRFLFVDLTTAGVFAATNPIDHPFKLFTSAGRPGQTSIFAAGSGYVVGDTVKDPFDGTFLATITQIGTLGAVTGYTVTNRGTEFDYTQGENDLIMVNTTPQSGAGSGFTLRCDSLRVNATASLRVFYRIR